MYVYVKAGFSSTRHQTSVDSVAILEFLSFVWDLEKYMFNILNQNKTSELFGVLPFTVGCACVRVCSESQQEHQSSRS